MDIVENLFPGERQVPQMRQPENAKVIANSGPIARVPARKMRMAKERGLRILRNPLFLLVAGAGFEKATFALREAILSTGLSGISVVLVGGRRRDPICNAKDHAVNLPEYDLKEFSPRCTLGVNHVLGEVSRCDSSPPPRS